MKTICLLGATGSIGQSAVDIVARHPDRFRFFALSAHQNVTDLVSLCLRFEPEFAVIADAKLHADLASQLKVYNLKTQALAGATALNEIASHPQADTVIAAIVGGAGLASTLAAALSGKRILLANKEAVVMAGPLLMQLAASNGAQILPVDSEHNAIFQCLPADFARNPKTHGVARVTLTASGGPFREFSIAQMQNITPDQACAHPNWVMGRKISVDSATLMNKGLEVIEAQCLFNLPADAIDVVIHPQSIVHSLVAYKDGSTLAQLGNPDMRTALANALAWPERIEAGVALLDLIKTARLDFEPPDLNRFPCLPLAYQAMQQGGTAPAILNAANEIAVAAFLIKQIGFNDISTIIAATLDKLAAQQVFTLDAVLEADQQARQIAHTLVTSRAI